MTPGHSCLGVLRLTVSLRHEMTLSLAHFVTSMWRRRSAMKFMYFFLPSIPATPQERKDLRPIAYHTERWQKMFDEVIEASRMAEPSQAGVCSEVVRAGP